MSDVPPRATPMTPAPAVVTPPPIAQPVPQPVAAPVQPPVQPAVPQPVAAPVPQPPVAPAAAQPAAAPPTPPADPERPRARRRGLLIAAVLMLLAGAAWWYWHASVAGHFEETDNAYVGGHVVQVTTQVPGTIVSIGVEDTDYVQAGQPLVALDPADSAIAVNEARAALAQAVREVRTLYVAGDTATATIRAREADVQRASAEVSRLQGDVERRSALVSSGAVSAEELNHVRDQLMAARSAAAAAQAAVVAAREQLNSARSLTDDTVVATHPAVQRASARLREAMLNESRTKIVAPVTGYVVRRTAQLGQRAQPGAALLSIAMLGDVWVDANFKEVQLRRMRIGQPVELTADQYGSKVVFHGRIIGMGAGTGAAFSILPAQNATGNWIKVVQRVPVRIELDPKELQQHPLRIGLSMLAKVDVQNEQGTMLQGTPAQTEVQTLPLSRDGVQAADAAIADIIARNSSGGGADARGQAAGPAPTSGANAASGASGAADAAPQPARGGRGK